MTGRVAKAFGAAAVVVAGLSPAADAGHLPAVAGETVVRVEGAAKMRISVPRRAAVAVDPAKAVEVRGGGRLVGLVLRENHPQGEELTFVRMPSQLGSKVYGWGPHAQVRCDQPTPGVTDCTKVTFPTHYDLRRGTYTLYAFTDGAPATVTLRFANYSGSTVVDPETPVEAGSADLATSVESPATWSGGVTVSTESRAELFTVAWWQQDESAAAQAGSCWYDGKAPAEKYAPGCPTGSGVSGGEVVNPVYGAWGPAKGGQRGVFGWASSVDPGTYGVGAWSLAQNVRGGAGFAYHLGR